MKMITITKREFNTLTGKFVFKSPLMNRLASLPRGKGILVERDAKTPYKYHWATNKVGKVMNRTFVSKKTLDGKNFAILRVK